MAQTTLQIKFPFLPYIIYSNVIKHFEKANVSLVDNELSEDEVKKAIQDNDFVEIIAYDNRFNFSVHYYIFDSTGYKESKKIGDYKELFKRLPKKGMKEIVIITEKDIRNPSRKNLLKESISNVLRVQLFTYDIFKIDVTKGPDVCPHEIVPKDEHAQLLDDIKLQSKKDLPKISVMDPQAIWIRARLGDIVRIWRTSQTAGVVPYYRLVIKPEQLG